MRITLLFALLAILISPAALRAQSGSAADEKAIRGIETHWEAAWNRHDFGALAGLMAPDVDFVNGKGLWIKGREQFLELNSASENKDLKDSAWKTESVEIKWLAPDQAMVHVYWTESGDLDDSGKSKPPHRGIFTRLDVKRGGQWLILLSQATSINAAPQPKDN